MESFRKFKSDGAFNRKSPLAGKSFTMKFLTTAGENGAAVEEKNLKTSENYEF